MAASWGIDGHAKKGGKCFQPGVLQLGWKGKNLGNRSLSSEFLIKLVLYKMKHWRSSVRVVCSTN